MDRAQELRELAASNSKLVCSVKGCNNIRDDLSRFCKSHLITYRRTGHPEGSTVSLKEMKPVRNDVKRFLMKHSGHPGIVAAIGWLDRTIATSFIPEGLSHYQPPSIQALEIWHRLKARGVTGEEVFHTLAAMALIRHRQPDRFHDLEEFESQLGTKVARHRFTSGIEAKPQHAQTGRAARRYIGQVIQLNIGLLLERLVIQLEKEKVAPPVTEIPHMDTAFDVTLYGAGPGRSK